MNRRKFLYEAGLLAFFTATKKLNGSQNPGNREDKKNLTILNDRPFIAETPAHLLDDDVTPTELLFVRNNGQVPAIANDPEAKGWFLEIDGEVKKILKLSLKQLLEEFKQVTYDLVLECAGNGRAAFVPQTKGSQWTYGAVGCPKWSGVLLKDILDRAGLKNSAKFVAYYGHDAHLSGDSKKDSISRGIDIQKALEDTTIIALKLNDKLLSPLHGFPARIICPGYPASASGKWLKRLWVRDRVHDGEKMNGVSYRMPKFPIEPGSTVLDSQMEIITKMPVKSLITFPKSGSVFKLSQTIECRGHAWSGAKDVISVDLSLDYGQTWIKSKLNPPKNSFAWQRFSASFKAPGLGYYELWARATDKEGRVQPMVVSNWNPKGYLNNAMARISFTVV